ncbi:pyrroline-5-carboxylate reductase family protein [Ewingella americana]|jgi:pyrroline-5-carboxylate reductase|uniref:Pyrroline-5-carboxylate reductase n=1 Tax=Ewingella americana TaxID=41202 RepID=A0A502GRU1_9GAMM|nr:pyrroline-5-carboxylate reductase dimerization domain-containing protein [Ewingella americana]TPG64889.1 pyrroline-5-carboxylate reductase [Ewingella americana]
MSHIHFVGAGQMAEAIIRAALSRGAVSAGDITLADIDQERITTLRNRYQLTSVYHDSEALAAADHIVIGVRPQDDIDGVARHICQHASANATLISIIAGVTLERLGALFGATRPIVRMIPNTLTDTGYGYSGVVFNPHVQAEPLMPFLESFGKVMLLEERLIDAFTGFAVAGVNYVYYFIESLTDAGVLSGLSRAQSSKVVWENLIGGVEMLKISDKHPRQLMDINNSPAGVGINGLYELNNSDFAAGLQRSVMTAVRRTTELSGNKPA